MRISDRTLGYLTILALACIFGLITFSMWKAHQNVNQVALVDFNELGSLQPEDPVVIRGYRVGTIGNVVKIDKHARVEIKFNNPIVLREGTQFNNINYALMGQRRLEIVPSKTGKICGPEYIFQGHFEPGIAEALKLMENVVAQLDGIRQAVLLLAEGDSMHQSATEIYQSAVNSIEGILDNTEKNLESLTPRLNTLFDQFDKATRTVSTATVQIDTTVKSAAGAVQQKLTLAEQAIQSIHKVSLKSNQIMADFENSPSVSKMLNSTETIDNINVLIAKLNKVIKAINTKGLDFYDENGNKIKLITWKNMNIIGKTAREKARERAEKAEKAAKENQAKK